MMHLIIILLFVLISFSHQLQLSPKPFNTTVIPVMKDASTSFHKVSWSFNLQVWDDTPSYLIDLDAPFTWTDCIVRKPNEPFCFIDEGCKSPLRCDDAFCKEAHKYVNPICPSRNITVKYGCKICAVTPFNPVSKSCKLSQLTIDLMQRYVTDGRNPFIHHLPDFGTTFVVSCAPSSMLRSFPKNVHGVAAFSWSSLAFPRQLSFPTVANKFALCLPNASSTTTPGVIFLGNGPFYFSPFPNLDLRTILSYTPMIRKTSKSLGYYIKISGISIKGTRIPLKSKSMKLSSIVPYTTLRSDIYKALVTSFSKATKNIPRVNVVKPFSLCLKASAIGSIGTKFHVPDIDLETESGKVWRITGDNSMKRIGNSVACLAFVDGGEEVKDAIVMGTFQMENNFLFMDLENQKLGFSSSLLSRGTSCRGFNFTFTE